MSLLKPFSLRIFVADGDPDGLRLVERSNWVGKAIVFPRALLPKIKQRAELNQTGVYLLLGPREDGEGVRSAKARWCCAQPSVARIRAMNSGAVLNTPAARVFGQSELVVKPGPE